jgi:hypothetical protein
MGTGYAELTNDLVSAANGHGNWDPVLIDLLATARRVMTFDKAGVGGSTGTNPDTIGQMARDAIAFIAVAGMHGWAPEVIGAIDTPNTSPEAYLEVFFTRSAPKPTGRPGSPAAHVRQDGGPGQGHDVGDP